MAQQKRNNNAALSYLGVSAAEPPDTIIVDKRDPGQGDFDFAIGTLWMRTDVALRTFQLLQKKDGLATWVQLYPVGGSPGAQNFITQNNTAAVNNGDISISGGVGLQTRAGTNNVIIEPNQPNLGFVFMSNIGFAQVTSPDNSITVNFTTGGLELAVATSIAAGTRSFQTDSGLAQPDSSNQIDIFGGRNINTEATGANEITVRTNDSLNLPHTTGTSTGVYKIDTIRFLHEAGPSGSSANTFVGRRSGNYSVTGSENVGVGGRSLLNITSGNFNTAVGFKNGRAITSGEVNTLLGHTTGFNLSSGGGNILLGAATGDNYTTESANILIGNFVDGVVGEEKTVRIGTSNLASSTPDRFFAAGIHNVTPAGSDQQTVIIDDQGQLGSTTSGAVTNVVASVITDNGTATPNASDELDLIGGQNIRTQASGNNITVETTDSINLPATVATATGTYRIDGEPVVHTFGNTGIDSNIFLGVNSGNFTLDPGAAVRNTGLGTDSLQNISQGGNNTALGAQTLQNTPNASDNVAVGFGAGNNYTTNESDNILITNDGVAGDTGTIRIGNPTDHTRAFMHGIYLVDPPGEQGTQYVVIDDQGQLGTTDYEGSGGIEAARVNIDAYLPQDWEVNDGSGGGTAGDPTPVASGGEGKLFGRDIKLTERADAGNDFFPGDGGSQEAVFTVPRDGEYVIIFRLTNGTTAAYDSNLDRSVLGEAEMIGFLGTESNPTPIRAASGDTGFSPSVPGNTQNVFRVARQFQNNGPDGVRLQAGDQMRFSAVVSEDHASGATPTIRGGFPSDTYNTQPNTEIIIYEQWSTGF